MNKHEMNKKKNDGIIVLDDLSKAEIGIFGLIRKRAHSIRDLQSATLVIRVLNNVKAMDSRKNTNSNI